MQPPGVEPGPLAWKARILTVRPRLQCNIIFRSIEVSIPACHAGDPGSIPGGRDFCTCGISIQAASADVGEKGSAGN